MTDLCPPGWGGGMSLSSPQQRQRFDKSSGLRYYEFKEVGTMKKFCVFLLAVSCFFLFFSGCEEAEKTRQPVMISIQEKDVTPKDEAVYKTRKVGENQRKVFTMDFDRISKPKSLSEFSTHFHHPPVRQGRTSTCWCFATTSFLESELHRLNKTKIKLSEMYTVYWEFVEKARGFIRSRGEQLFTRGSEHNAVFLRMNQYGAVPLKEYPGLLETDEEYNHFEMYREIQKYLEFCRENQYWDEDKAITYVKTILDNYMGKPPEIINMGGKEYTPKEYLDEVLKLKLDDYVSFISFLYLPFYSQGEFKVPDNWWHSKKYYNIPLDEFYSAITKALKNGFTAALGGDVSEPGKSGDHDIAVIPNFDIHPVFIGQDSREFRFVNRTSTDDHAIHAVGIKEDEPHTWILVKDSGRSAYSGRHQGYYFFREDFIQLKMLTFTVHKDAVADILSRFPSRN